MLKHICKYLLLLVTVDLSAQPFMHDKYNKQMEALNRVIINSRDSVVYAYIYRDGDKNVNPRFDKYYYWFASNDIKRTKGGYDGKLLHGDYSAFFLNKDLLSQGKFRYGLKQGEWKSWYKGGEIKSKEKWHKGVVVGTSHYYSSAGLIQEKRKYTDKKGSRIVTSYNDQGGILSKKYYEKNILINTVNYQLDKKGNYVAVKPEENKKIKTKNKKDKDASKTKKSKADKSNKKKKTDKTKSTDKTKKNKIPKIKIHKFKQIVPGGAGA